MPYSYLSVEHCSFFSILLVPRVVSTSTLLYWNGANLTDCIQIFPSSCRIYLLVALCFLKGLEASEDIITNQPLMEYIGHVMMKDQYDKASLFYEWSDWVESCLWIILDKSHLYLIYISSILLICTYFISCLFVTAWRDVPIILLIFDNWLNIIVFCCIWN